MSCSPLALTVSFILGHFFSQGNVWGQFGEMFCSGEIFQVIFFGVISGEMSSGFWGIFQRVVNFSREMFGGMFGWGGLCSGMSLDRCAGLQVFKYKANLAVHPSGVGKWVPASAGKAKAGMVHSVSGWTRGVQVKLWDFLRTRAIPERLRGVITTRRCTNSRLPLPLPLPLYVAVMISLTKVNTHRRRAVDQLCYQLS